MILFVFEGEEREPELYKTLERLYFPRENDNIVCSFGNNIYALYMEMLALEGDGDIVSVMKGKLAERGERTCQKGTYESEGDSDGRLVRNTERAL